MKTQKIIFFKLLFIAIFAIFISATFNNSYCYEIHHIVKTKEELGQKDNSSFPEMIYRKQVSAYDDTIKKYKNGKSNKYSGTHYSNAYTLDTNTDWVYASTLGGNYPEDNSYSGKNNNDPHNNNKSFERIYEFFHQYQNSEYTTNKSEGQSAKLNERYYATGNLDVDNGGPWEQTMSHKSVWNVWGESGNYAGVYWTIASSTNVAGFRSDFENINNIVIMDSNLYRFAVINDVFVSDNRLVQTTIENLKRTFGNNNSSKTLTIYGSSVLRTSYKNAKSGEQYYQNMDTAYKFWESTIRGSDTAKGNWTGSPSTTGTDWNGNVQATRSVINYYDNTYEIPNNDDNPKKIYIRHIDVSDLNDIKSSKITNEMVLDVVNGQTIIQKPNYFSPFKGDYKGPNLRSLYNENVKYSEYYEKSSTDEDWRFGNIKYEVNDATLGYMSYLHPFARSNEQGYALSALENNILNNYDCIGAVVGKGDSFQNAVNSKDTKLNSITNFRNVADEGGSYIGSAAGAILKNGDYTSAIVTGGEQSEYIIIDFYYEKKPTKIYVRHIDVGSTTNISDNEFKGYNTSSSKFLQTRSGKAFYLKPSDWNYSEGTINTEITSNTRINGNLVYQESYTKSAGSKPLKVANIKYNHETAGSYWNLLSNDQQNKYKNYVCIGAVVGKGNSLDVAETNRGNIKTENGVDNKTEFVNKLSSELKKEEDRYIEKNYDYTSVIVSNNDYNTIVVDFYYISNSPTSLPPTSPYSAGSQYKYVYVRHIDVTDFASSINANKIDKAIISGKVLRGKGTALKNNTRTINKENIILTGYQELYKIGSADSLQVYRDPSDDDYICIGSNVTSDSAGSITNAKNKMDNVLNSSSKYNSSLISSRIVQSTDKDVILIDFYYKSKHTGTPIARVKKGRLAFYTTGQSSQFTSLVDNHTDTDSATVYDVLPANEVLRMSIDNAYVYMLGAINIKEQTIENTYTFDYTVTQNYKVTYKDWSSSCSGPCDKTYSDKKEGNCGNTYYYDSTCPDPLLGSKPCRKSATCNGTWTSSSEDIETTGSVSKTYTYSIPYKYTYYKVKNMRLYSISKIELLDAYSNKGLPLFGGRSYTVLPTSNYTSSFSNLSNSGFEISSNSESSNRTTKTLDTTLYYTYDNNNGDVNASVPKGDAESKINTLFNAVNHSDAAKLANLVKDNAGTIGETTDHLKATLNIKNDEVYFTDGVENETIYLVGDASKNTSTALENSRYEVSNSKSEKNAQKVIDLYSYTYGKAKSGNGTISSKYTYTTTDSDKVNVSTVYPKSVKSKYMPNNSTSKNLTTKDYFETINLNIPESRLNGKYYSYGKIYYNLISGNKNLNFDVLDSKVKNGSHDWNKDSNRTAVKGQGGNTFVDTEMYNDSGNSSPAKTTFITSTSLPEKTFEYGKDNASDADIVDVFSPISFSTQIISNTSPGTNTIVDHTTTNNNNQQDKQIQKNSRFTIEMRATNQNSTYSGLMTKKYLGQYYIKFNFDVQDITIYDARRESGRAYISGSVPAGNWIGPIYNKDGSTYATNGIVKISAFALADPNTANSVVNQESNNYEVRAVADNASASLIYDVARGRIPATSIFITQTANNFSGTSSNNIDHNQYYDKKDIYGHSNYVSEISVDTENISRVYDFKVTDLKDVDWKNIFRKSTTTTTNVHSGNAYYSGVKKWNIYTTNYNDLVERSVAEIGATKQQILPLGPYKNTNKTYVKAPKLGYKFSFDLKTTGANSNKKVIITPSFYYIGKNGEGYTSDVKLYYKNSSNKYIDISNYNLYFVPDDGYRLTFEGTDAAYRFSNSLMKKSSVYLGTTKKITLTKDMMEQADHMFVQIWYGEYKLPNSTIIVAKDASGNYNVNNKLTNGYIGVKFNIEVEEYTSASMNTISKVLNYAQNNKNAASNTNTSQWDYEGYLGFSSPGSSANNIRVSLEKGIWRLNNDMYNNIKGTVILYDTDAKASSDYD